ncbi:MAG: hypothetical protein QXO47_10020, partial [Thermoproteota archaeon]
ATGTDSSTGATVTSNTVTVTESAPSPTIGITATTTTSLPSSGGTVSFVANYVGFDIQTTLYVFVNGTETTTFATNNGFSNTFSLSFPSNSSAAVNSYAVDVASTTSNT